MVSCPYCSAEGVAGKFCGECGQRIPATPTRVNAAPTTSVPSGATSPLGRAPLPNANQYNYSYLSAQEKSPGYKQPASGEVDTSTLIDNSAFNKDEVLAAEEKRVEKTIKTSTEAATWDNPSPTVRRNYRAEMSPQEEMEFLRQKRKEKEEQLRREGKIR